jgi:hypothetical protein
MAIPTRPSLGPTRERFFMLSGFNWPGAEPKPTPDCATSACRPGEHGASGQIRGMPNVNGPGGEPPYKQCAEHSTSGGDT